MNTKDAIRSTLKTSHGMLNMVLADLSDDDLLVRPVPHANHIAWQLGHLISSEARMIQTLGGTPPELPAGFADQHGKATADVDPPKGFATKAQYIDLLNKMREASLAAADKLPEADLGKPVEGPVGKIAPTMCALAMLPSSHALMHLGQFSVVRRKLGKPVLF